MLKSRKTTHKKQLAARVLCGLLLGAYLTAGYCMPTAWGELSGDGMVEGKFIGEVTNVTIRGYNVSAAYDNDVYATAWGPIPKSASSTSRSPTRTPS